MTEIVRRTIALACPVEHAFDVFTQRIDLWWPRGHRRNRDASLSLEPFAGGRLIERSADGSEWTMGRVTEIAPPLSLSLDWFPGSPAAPTSVEVVFEAKGDGTEIVVSHRPLSDGAQAIWPERVTLFERGWDTVLPALRQFVVTQKGV